MIYDGFAFFNELELLEIRLNVLDQVVDKFILVESRQTFTKKPKPLYFEENKMRFAPFLHKIEHIIIEKFPSWRWDKFRVPHAWDCGNYQKEQITRGLKNFKRGDVLIVSDVDEIPNPDKVRSEAGKPGIHVFEQLYANYFLNTFSVIGPNDSPNWWYGSVMLNYSDFSSIKKTRLYRGKREKGIIVHPNGGWHFSFLGDWKKIVEKLGAFEHTEFDTDYHKNPERVQKIIEEGGDLFDSGSRFKSFDPFIYLPEYVAKNINLYSDLINKNIVKS